MGFISDLAASTGQNEQALLLLVTLVCVFPIALFHRFFLYRTNPTLQHVYGIVAGVALTSIVFGWYDMLVYAMSPSLVVYALLFIFGPSSTLSGAIFFSMLTYLLSCYSVFSSEDYDINWTTAFCVMFLRITSLVMDLSDGKLPEEKLSRDQKQFAVRRFPNLLEYLGFVWFYPAVLVGPTDNLSRYLAFTEGRLGGDDNGRVHSSSFGAAAITFGKTIFAAVLSTVLAAYFPSNLLITPEFEALPLPLRWLRCLPMGTATFAKYCIAWGLTEVSCTLVGYSYNGTDKNGKMRWDQMNNVDVFGFLTYTSSHGVIDVFNKKTNDYLKRYIFKRVAFLGNKNLSMAIMAAFISLWHGVHINYLIVFILCEVPMVIAERQFWPVFENLAGFTVWTAPGLLRYPLILLAWLYAHFFFTYGSVGMNVLQWNNLVQSYKNIFFCCHIAMLMWFSTYALLIPSRLKKSPQ
eukprot:scpid82386/ scgid12243/ Lysophospholipid acyltransferase 5; 1-acylglycerophosphocholine O-acyltransferase; 1-acylglycerophosphoserine O-acyltransferase; Lysophosphatidylcholine acyltransferase; Lysophosphatidylcholine acyltransferase 3; Lysophosphatidylserine acyltransferase; Membrane-bound O-acyltransferase domain-containing protein 5